MKEVDGLLNSKRQKVPEPKPSPKDFVWPSQGDHDDKVAQKIAASLQELLPPKNWTHSDLARELWGTGKTGQARNIGASRRYLTAEHPIPNERTAAFIADLLGVSMARLLEPEGKFEPWPDMIRERKDGKKAKRDPDALLKKKKGKRHDLLKQRAYNKAYRERKKLEAGGKVKRKYTKRGLPGPPGPQGPAGNGNGHAWVLSEGVPVPEYTFASTEDHPGHLRINITAIVPHPRAMAILHMLEHQAPEAEE